MTYDLNRLNVSNLDKKQKGATPFTSIGLSRHIETSCKILKTSTETFGYATAVKLVGEENGIFIIDKVANDTEDVFGFLMFNLIKDTFLAGEIVPVLRKQEIMTMEASGSIPLNSNIMIVPTGDKIAVATAGKYIIGKNRQASSINGDLIDIELK